MTLTAPGEDLLPWDTTVCRHSAGVACSGSIGCVVEARALAEWHHGMAGRWTHFVTELRRSVPHCEVQFFKTYEEQARGALHVHAMLRVVGSARFGQVRRAIGKAARYNGFGDRLKVEAIDLREPRQAARVAGYCAKYSAKNADTLPDVVRLDPSTGEVRHGGLRPWSASRRWGVCMAQVRQRRSLWASAAAGAAGVAAEPPLDPYCDIYAELPDGTLIVVDVDGVLRAV